MSTSDSKPTKVKMLNPKMLTIAAVLLIVLALLFLVTPLLRTASVPSRMPAAGQFPAQGNPGQAFPGGPNGQGQVNPGSPPNQGGQNIPEPSNRQFPAGRVRALRLVSLSGMTGTIIYTAALLVSLLAAVGMFNIKRWGQILGIVIAVVYLFLAVVNFLPMLMTMRFVGSDRFLFLIPSVLQLLLAIAVIVFALLPSKKITGAEIAPPPVPSE